MNARNLTATVLSRKSGVSAPQITRLLSGHRGVSEIFLRTIAEALSISPDMMFRVAGFLPPACEKTENHEKSLYLLDQLDENQQEMLLAFMQTILRKR